MEFYPEKLRKIRKQKRLTIIELAALAESNRTSIANWELGKQIPPEKRIRILASALDVPVSEISDLESYSEISNKLPQLKKSWVELAESSSGVLQEIQEQTFANISKLSKIVEESSIIVKALLKSLPISFYIKSPSLHYIAANNHFYKEILHSYVHRDIVGLCDKDIFPVRDAIVNEREDQEVISTSVSVINKERFMPGTRKKKTVLATKTPVFDRGGRIIGLLGVFVDITERKDYEKELEKLKYVVNHLEPVQAMVWYGENLGTKDFQLHFVSEGQARFTGIPNKQLYKDSLTWEKMIHPDDQKMMQECLKKVLTPKPIQFRLNTQYGTKWIENYQLQAVICGEKIDIGTSRDITEKKQYELYLEKLLHIMNNLDTIVWVGEKGGTKNHRLHFINDIVETITGIPKEDFLSDGTTWQRMLHPEDKERVLEWYFKPKFPRKIEYRINTKQGVKWLEDSQLENVFHGEKIQFGIVRDVTMQKEKDLEMKALKSFSKKRLEVNWIKSNDEKSSTIFISETTEQVYGVDHSEFSKDANLWLNFVHRDDKEREIHWNNNKTFPYLRKYRIVTQQGNIKQVEHNSFLDEFEDETCIFETVKCISQNQI